MPNRVVHFEIGAKDPDKLSDFYASAFGWNMEKQGEEMGGYIVATTGPQIPKDIKEVGISGGIYEEKKKEINAFRCVVGVDDIKKAVADIKSAGGKVYDDNTTPDGKVLGEVMDIPGIGLYAKCQDPEGNFFTLLQPSPDMMSKP